MPSRIIPFVNGYTYHIYNRGTEKRKIFQTDKDFLRFLKILTYYQFSGPKPRFSNSFRYKSFNAASGKKLVEILSFCLMPNHFHLMIKQIKDDGITELISKISNSHTKYFNNKNNRVGPLLQGEFKSVLVESDEQLIHLNRYIHLNPLVANLVESLDEYKWSSYHEYINIHKEGICTKEEVLSFFKSTYDYKKFILDHADYAKQLESIKHKLIEED